MVFRVTDKALTLMEYIEFNVIPTYELMDKGHGLQHIEDVMQKCSDIIQDYPEINANMIYVIAAYHDLGRKHDHEYTDKENIHEKLSAKLLMEDVNIWKWFTEEEIEVMAQAIEDHRASGNNPPRSIYGKIIADGDRNLNCNDIIRRSLGYNMNKYPNSNKEELYQTVRAHMVKKYGYGGYLKLYLNWKGDVEALEDIRKRLVNEETFKEDFNAIWKKEAVA